MQPVGKRTSDVNATRHIDKHTCKCGLCQMYYVKNCVNLKWVRGEGSADVIKVLNQHLGGQEGAEVRDRSQEETDVRTNLTVVEKTAS